MGGMKAFTDLSVQLAFGEDAKPIQEGRVAAVQSLSGTGMPHICKQTHTCRVPNNCNLPRVPANTPKSNTGLTSCNVCVSVSHRFQ